MADLKTVWNGNSKGNGSITANNLDVNIAIPESLGGSGEGTGPKELLVSSAAACYITMLAAILEARKLPVIELKMDSDVSMTKEEGLKIVHYPYITFSADATEDQIEKANRAFASADKACSVGNLLKKAEVQITIEGKVTVN